MKVEDDAPLAAAEPIEGSITEGDDAKAFAGDGGGRAFEGGTYLGRHIL